MSTQFNCQKHFSFKLFKQLYKTIQFSVSIVSMSKIVQFKAMKNTEMSRIYTNLIVGLHER